MNFQLTSASQKHEDKEYITFFMSLNDNQVFHCSVPKESFKDYRSAKDTLDSTINELLISSFKPTIEEQRSPINAVTLENINDVFESLKSL